MDIRDVEHFDKEICQTEEPVRYLWKKSLIASVTCILLYFPFLRADYDIGRFVVKNVQHSAEGVYYEVSCTLAGNDRTKGFVQYGKRRECLRTLADGDVLTIYKSRKQSVAGIALEKIGWSQPCDDYDLEARIDKDGSKKAAEGLPRI